MAKLILNPTSAGRRDIPLPRTILSIGRDPSNDLVLPDAMVSRRHALIECRGSQFFLRDCNSSNGSLVNGDRVSERGLRDGDLVAIGSVRLLFREEAESSAKVVPHPSAPRFNCPGCQADYRKGDLFCRQCGARLEEAPPRVVCTACGTAVLLPARFCNACGQVLAKGGEPDAQAAAPSAPLAPAPRGVERTQPREQPEDGGTPSVDGEAASPPGNAAGGRPAAPPRAQRGAGESGSSGSRPGLALAVIEAPARPAPARPREQLAPVPAPPAASRPAAARAGDDRLHRTTRPLATDPRLPAPAALRLAAALIDLALVVAVLLIATVPPVLYWRGRTAAAAPGFVPILASVSLAVLVLLLVSAYYVHSWGLRGATLGQRLLGLGVHGVDGRFPVGAGRAALRLLGYALSAGALGLGFAAILFGATSLHDRIAGTVVLKEPGR